MKTHTPYWLKSIIVVLVLYSGKSELCHGQENYQVYFNEKVELDVLSCEVGAYRMYAQSQMKFSDEEKNGFRLTWIDLKEKQRVMNESFNAKYNSIQYGDLRKQWSEVPNFQSKKECLRYKSAMENEAEANRLRSSELSALQSALTDWKEKWGPTKCNSTYRQIKILTYKNTVLWDKIHACDCENIDYSSVSNSGDENLEAEFLAEIAKINADIKVINLLAREKKIKASFGNAQALCDKLRRYQGDQYFSRTLKEIRKENPGFSFSITPLAEEVTREYWIRMRNRANHAYRNALEAQAGCVWNEGIQSAGFYEIPYAYTKLGFDLFLMVQDIMEKSFYGTMQSIYRHYKDPTKFPRPIMAISEDVLKGGNDAYDWKSYAGLLGGVISAYDNFEKAQAMVTEHVAQEDLITANRESAKELIRRGRILLQQFDKYRAFIDSHSSSIDCLNDRIMRIDLDNKSIKGDKITIWGTGLYDWDVDFYTNQIVEAGEDLKNEYIYCEDFIKALQIAINQGNTNFISLEEKVRNSGADQTQITAQLSHNRENADWFEDESQRLLEQYIQYCEDENNTYPDDVIIVSNQVIPGVEEQDGNPDDPPVWEYESDVDTDPIEDPPHHDPYEEPHNTGGGSGSAGIISSGNGWSAQQTSTNETVLQNDITTAVNSGKTPAGIYVGDDGEVVVYYIDDNPLGMTAWNLEWYDGVETLQDGINTNLEQGYFPMGISFTDNGKLYVLYIMSQLQATAWQLVESQLDLAYVSNDVQPYTNEKYIPVGITVFGGMYYTLMAQVLDSELVSWTIEGYENNNYSIEQSVNNKVNSGLVPFGYLKEGEVVNVLYVGF